MEINERSKKYYTILDKILKSAIFFNRIVDGKYIEEYSKDELVDKINAQFFIAKEEVDEFFTAKENNDIVEMYDGAIDTLYTVPFLISVFVLSYFVCVKRRKFIATQQTNQRKDERKKTVKKTTSKRKKRNENVVS